MWPWGHAAVAYLACSGVERGVGGRSPAGAATVAAMVGGQLPDLIDKPLAWSVPLLPSGRSLAHSWLVAIPVLAVLAVLAARRDDRSGTLIVALGVGWLSHGLADAVAPVVAGELRFASFLVWPLVATPYDPTGLSILEMLTSPSVGPWFVVEWLLVAAAIVAWQVDGRPGLITLRESAGRIVPTAVRE